MSARRQTWRVEGMRCAHCEAAVVRAVSSLPGVKNARSSCRSGTLTADWDPALSSRAEIDACLREAGYGLRRGGAGTTAARLAAFAAVARPMDVERAMESAYAYLRSRARDVGRLWAAARAAR